MINALARQACRLNIPYAFSHASASILHKESPRLDGIRRKIMGIRKSISTKTRFEVFKRDSFTCQYCGANPPKAILHVDHIVPVAEGGPNNMDNFVTSCQSCNLGKGARSLQAIPQSLKEKSAEIAEKEAQIIGYQKVMQAKQDRITHESWQVCDALKPNSSSTGFNRQNFQSVISFINRLDYFSVLESAQIANSKYHYNQSKCFLYFCGICWNKIKVENHGAR